MKPEVILITGASGGIGASCMEALGKSNYRVYGTSRSGPDIKDIPIPGHDNPCRIILPMDVTSRDSVHQAVNFILEKEGRIDGVINNAGYGLGGAVEDVSIEEGKALFNTNVWGALRVCQAVLPVMRSRHSGRIINIGSLGGSMSVPFQGLYCASKFALRGMTDALRMEVKRFGIRVVLIEPGDVHTGFTQHRVMAGKGKENPVYKEQLEKAMNIIEHEELNGIQPHKIARIVVAIMKKRNPHCYYTTGPFIQILAWYLQKLLPRGIMDSLISGFYK